MGTLTAIVFCFVALLIVLGFSFILQTLAIAHVERNRVVWVPVDENLQPLEPQPATFDNAYPMWDWAQIGGKS